MADEEVRVRLDSIVNWPNHCGSVMSLRHIGSASPKTEPCSHQGCRFASYAACSCSCLGKYHGVNNPARNFDSASAKPLPWYRKPIKTFIELSV